MRDILRRYQPTRIEDLTALNALYRPGPIQGGMIDDFINRKHGKTKVSYELPQLQDILGRNLRRHLVSGTGDADRQPLGELFAGRSGYSAPRHGQEEKRGNGGAAREVHGWMRDQQDSREKGRANFQFDGRVCGIRLQQVAFLRVCAAGLSDRVLEDALSGRVHGGAADFGNREQRKRP